MRKALMGLVAAGFAVLPVTGQARVARFVIYSVEPMATVAGAPAYELLTGQFVGELDPRAASNRIITDISLAPRNARGLVEYSATFKIARPIDPARASGVLFYSVPNRGGGVALAADPSGHTYVISGWQGDIPRGPNVQYLLAPVAKGVTGPLLVRMSGLRADAPSAVIGGYLAQTSQRPLAVSLDTRHASLVAERMGEPNRSIPASDWAFADCKAAPFPGRPDPSQLCLKGGFDPDAAYRLTYTAKDPPVLGTGFAATRDLVAFLRSGRADDSSAPNPAGTAVRWTIGQGNSQSGNFLRSFVHLGFNADESGKQVFDGINPNIAARQISLNLRFGQPGGAAFQYEPGSEGVLWWGRYTDKARGLGTTSLLDRCNSTNTCPKIIETLGSAEFWGLRASPGFVGSDARADIALPANVRRYYFPSVTHGGAFVGGGFKPQGAPVPQGCELAGNPATTIEQMKVAVAALVDWVRADKEPPASRYPTIAGGDLVAPNNNALGWPTIPAASSPEGKLNPWFDYDFGPGFVARDLSGRMSRVPPRLRRVLPQLVPKVNADGNETAGVAPLHLRVPLGTYTGWNVQATGYGKGGGCGFAGGFIPFARTKAERLASGDPRLSLEERYGNHAGFVSAVRREAEGMVREGWLLANDAARMIAEAEKSTVLN
jgi:hypothetical protein